jgi:hypothetical protein
MTRLPRLALLLVPLALGALIALPGRAQQASTSARFAFADTTLLRDTLGLTFEELFPLADSLRVLPDTLRALSIRYRAPLRRVVFLADSMAVPVDSVGVILERERFNPLAARREDVNALHVSSSYNVAQTSSSWINSSDWNRVRGPLVLRNTTNISMDRYRAGGLTSLRQTRTSQTETGWRLSRDLSVGGRFNLERFDTRDPGGINDEGETKNEAQFSMRSRQRPTRGLNSELNLFSGLLDLTNSRQVKRGLSGDLNGRVRLLTGGWLTQDLSGQLTGTLARTRLPTSPLNLSTRDRSANLSGTMGLFSAAPVGLNLNYRVRRVLVETPLDSGRIQQVRTENNSVDLGMRGRLDSDRQLNVTGHFGTTKQAQGNALNSLSTRRDLDLTVDGRYVLLGVLLEGRFTNGKDRSEFPRRGTDGGYGEDLHGRSVSGTATRKLGPRVTFKANGSVDLSSFRYYLIGRYPSPPVDREQYRQSFRLEGLYAASQDLTSAMALDVVRLHSINLPAASAGSNSETRTYRAEWRWSYRLMPSLTATQRNSVSADYLFYDFRRRDSRLTLVYGNVTTLNAVLGPRFQIDVTHNVGYQPSGNYAAQADGEEAFSRSDENRNYTLSARMTYSPTPALSINVQPDYYASRRNSTVNGELSPQRSDRSLNFSGGANLNFALGRRGRLTGDIRRTFRTARAVSWVKGEAQPATGTDVDYWIGTLVVTWDL